MVLIAKIERAKKLVIRIAWVAFLISLPITSFPFFPGGLGGSTLVRPLSIYPLLILLALVILPKIFSKPLPRTILSLIPFLIIASLSTLFAIVSGIEPLQGVSLLERMVRALATLGIGVAIYLTVSVGPENPEDLKDALRWIYVGFLIALAWGSLQAIYVVHFSSSWFTFLSQIQRFISTRRLFTNRISGMTFEPNWFADQISFLLLPWLLAAVLNGTTVFTWRYRWITVEMVLLLWALILLPFTYSRAGLAVMLVLIVVAIVFLRQKPAEAGVSRSRVKPLPLKRVVEALALVGLLSGLVYLAGTRNEFFARVWDYWKRRPAQESIISTLSGYFEYLGFGARFSYWQAAYNIYEKHPVMGVGLGNYVFYFDEALPDRPMALYPEVLRLVVPEVGRDRLITSKNLYLRLLSETGITGLAAFLAFVMGIAGCVLYLWLSTDHEARFWGKAGILGLIAFGLIALSFDSFALPNMWVLFGLITSAARLEKSRILDG